MTLGSGQSAGHKRRFEECERIFGNQQFYSIEELSDEDLLYGDHPLPGNENGSSNLERLDNIIIGLPLASATSVQGLPQIVYEYFFLQSGRILPLDALGQRREESLAQLAAALVHTIARE